MIVEPHHRAAAVVVDVLHILDRGPGPGTPIYDLLYSLDQQTLADVAAVATALLYGALRLEAEHDGRETADAINRLDIAAQLTDPTG